jgi:hypothetical protein
MEEENKRLEAKIEALAAELDRVRLANESMSACVDSLRLKVTSVLGYAILLLGKQDYQPLLLKDVLGLIAEDSKQALQILSELKSGRD